ncbi:MAG: hypothetical protein MOB07_23270 [Acidobacteria bacterium]|nr:hypothetical protein [Acidobacteriota bacterium]
MARIQADALELTRQAMHVAQGEPGTIVLMERNNITNELMDNKPISAAWNYSGMDYLNDDRLPPGVDYELRVSELHLRDEELKRGVAWKHGRRIFQIVGRPMPPSGSVRFWRFNVSLSETVAE